MSVSLRGSGGWRWCVQGRGDVVGNLAPAAVQYNLKEYTEALNT